MAQSNFDGISDVRIMFALFGKDWRFFRLPTIVLLSIIAGGYVLVFTLVPEFQWGSKPMPLLEKLEVTLVGGAAIGIAVTSLLSSVFTGISVAGERTDRTADFVALLPVTRRQIILSKLLVSGAIVGGCTAFSCILILLVYYCSPDRSVTNLEFLANAAVWAGFTVSLYGIAWLCSTLFRSGPISASVSIAVTVTVGILSFSIDQTRWAPLLMVFATGIISLIAGTIYYLRRIEP